MIVVSPERVTEIHVAIVKFYTTCKYLKLEDVKKLIAIEQKLIELKKIKQLTKGV